MLEGICQGTVCRSGAGGMGYGLGIPERAGSLAMGAPREEPSGSVCSGSDTHNSMFFRGVLPQGGLARLRETVPCGYPVEKKVDLLNCLQGDYIYVATDHMTYIDMLLSQQRQQQGSQQGHTLTSPPPQGSLPPMIQRVLQCFQKNQKKGEKYNRP